MMRSFNGAQGYAWKCVKGKECREGHGGSWGRGREEKGGGAHTLGYRRTDRFAQEAEARRTDIAHKHTQP